MFFVVVYEYKKYFLSKLFMHEWLLLKILFIEIYIYLSKLINGLKKYRYLFYLCERYSAPKVEALVKVLKDFYTQQQNFCCIIFVERRFTAKVLCHILKVSLKHEKHNLYINPPNYIKIF